jgi:hypothetical protein
MVVAQHARRNKDCGTPVHRTAIATQESNVENRYPDRVLQYREFIGQKEKRAKSESSRDEPSWNS